MTFSQCVFSNVSSSCLPRWMHSRIGCICSTFSKCVFSNVSSNRLLELMHNHTSCICFIFPQCVFSNVSSIFLPRLVYSRIGSIYLKRASQITCLLQFLIDPSPCSKTNHLPDRVRRQVHPQLSLSMMSSVTRLCIQYSANGIRAISSRMRSRRCVVHRFSTFPSL